MIKYEVKGTCPHCQGKVVAGGYPDDSKLLVCLGCDAKLYEDEL